MGSIQIQPQYVEVGDDTDDNVDDDNYAEDNVDDDNDTEDDVDDDNYADDNVDDANDVEDNVDAKVGRVTGRVALPAAVPASKLFLFADDLIIVISLVFFLIFPYFS